MTRITYAPQWEQSLPSEEVVSFLRRIAVACTTTGSRASGAGRDSLHHAFRALGRVVRHGPAHDADQTIEVVIEGDPADAGSGIVLLADVGIPGLPPPSDCDSPEGARCASFIDGFLDHVGNASLRDQVEDATVHEATLRAMGVAMAQSRAMPYDVATIAMSATTHDGLHRWIDAEIGHRIPGRSWITEAKVRIASPSITRIATSFPTDLRLEAETGRDGTLEMRIRKPEVRSWVDVESIHLHERLRMLRHPALAEWDDGFQIEKRP